MPRLRSIYGAQNLTFQKSPMQISMGILRIFKNIQKRAFTFVFISAAASLERFQNLYKSDSGFSVSRNTSSDSHSKEPFCDSHLRLPGISASNWIS